MVRKGQVKPGAELEILHDRGGVVQVSGGWNYGPVTATRAAELAIERARSHAIVAVTVRDCNHVARLGRFVDLIARQGNLIGVLCANGHGSDLAVAPYGGRERRLPTNPLAVGIPTRRDWPIVLDMTTSMTSGGALRDYRNRGVPAPEGSLIDGRGRLTTDVEGFYGDPPGALLPLGFPVVGHKGFGLALVIDILAGGLSGGGCSQADPPETGNALFFTVYDIAAFRDPGGLPSARWTTSSTGSSPVRPWRASGRSCCRARTRTASTSAGCGRGWRWTTPPGGRSRPWPGSWA